MKTHVFATGGLYSPHGEPCDAHFIMNACVLFDILCNVQQKQLLNAMIELGIARTIFNIGLTPTEFI